MLPHEAPAISDSTGIAIVSEARRAAAEHLGVATGSAVALAPCRYSGVFVTIGKAGSLRGCIGFTSAIRTLSDDVAEAAIAAATQDPRFAPMRADELPKVTFEVTVLSEAQRLAGPRDRYPSEITIGRDGLIVDDGQHKGLLLPQVPTELGWNSVEFLDQVCKKAGLDCGCWMDDRVGVSRFSGTVFKEVEPNGRIVRA